MPLLVAFNFLKVVDVSDGKLEKIGCCCCFANNGVASQEPSSLTIFFSVILTACRGPGALSSLTN